MAQSKFTDLAGKFGKGGGPPGLGIGLKLLAVGGVVAYGVTQSMYTGKCKYLSVILVRYISTLHIISI